MTVIFAIVVLTILLVALTGALEWNDRRNAHGVPSWHSTDADTAERDADSRRLWSELEAGQR